MTKTSTLKPFAAGDLFLGCTYLCNPRDDHAGEGRILQFDRHMVPKGTLYTADTTHLVINLRFAPDGVLWAFDPFAHVVVRVSPAGQVLPRVDFGDRAWGSVAFGPAGQVYLCEYLRGDKPYEGGDMRLLPGTGVVGYGRIAEFDAAFRPVREFHNDLSPSLTGFHGVTHCAMHPDGHSLAYITDLGMRVMRYDVAADRQLPDLVSYPGGEAYVRRWTTGVEYLPDGTLLLLRGSFIDFIGPEGDSRRTVALDEYGYAMLTLAADGQHVFAANIFTGNMVKLRLADGAIVGRIDTGLAKPARSLAGVAEYRGPAAA